MALANIIFKSRIIPTFCKVNSIINDNYIDYYNSSQNLEACKNNKIYQKVLIRGKKTLVEELLSHKSITKELNLPQPPKKPATPALNFMNEERKNFPEMSVRDAIKFVSEKWNNFSESEKAKYKDIYTGELEKYRKKLSQYEHELTEEQKHNIKVLMLNKKKEKLQKDMDKLSRNNKKEAEALGKPKMPGNTVGLFWKFLMEKSDKKLPLAEALQKWNALPDKEKDKFKDLFKEKFSTYKEELDKWEKRMIQEGKSHLVRKSTLK